MLEFYAEDTVVVDRRPVGRGEFRGRDALSSYYEGLFDNVAGLHEELEVVHERDEVVIAACRTSAQIAGDSGPGALSFDYALRITMAAGLISSMEIYEDVKAAAAAAGS